MTKTLGESFTPFINSVGKSVASYHASPPRDRAIARAQLGTVLLVLALYGWLFTKEWFGFGIDELAAAFLRSPSTAPATVWWMLGTYGGGTLLGIVWVVSGLRGSGGGPANGLAAFWAAIRIVLYIGVIHWAGGGSFDWRDWPVLVIAPLLAADVVGFLLELRSGPRAKDIVIQQIEDAEISWRPAKRRGRG